MALRDISVIRHGKATPLKKGMAHAEDLGRLLTQEGMKGVAERCLKLGNPNYDLVLYSPTARTAMTALLLSKPSTFERFIALDELCYKGPEDPIGKKMWDTFWKLGTVSLGAYCTAAGSEIFEEHGRKAWQAVQEQVEHHNARSTLVVGHHPFINALGYAAVEYSDEWKEIFKTTSFEEAQGFTFALRDKDILDAVLRVD